MCVGVCGVCCSLAEPVQALAGVWLAVGSIVLKMSAASTKQLAVLVDDCAKWMSMTGCLIIVIKTFQLDTATQHS